MRALKRGGAHQFVSFEVNYCHKPKHRCWPHRNLSQMSVILMMWHGPPVL